MGGSTTPFWYAILGVVVGCLLTFLLNRLTKKQDRRLEWYDEIDGAVAELVQELKRITPRLDTTSAGLQQALIRLEVLEQKMGPFWRYIEDNIAESLKPRLPPRAPRRG